MARGKFQTLSLDNPLFRRVPAAVAALSAPRAGNASSAASRDFKAYTEARHNAAESATRGNLVNAAGRRQGITGKQWFTGKNVSTKYASDELKDWLKSNGKTMSPSEYRSQAAPRASDYENARMSDS